MGRSKGIKDKVVAITGGARGIGLATARDLERAGAKVAIGDVDPDALAAAERGLGSAALATRLDVTDRGSFAEFLKLAERELGPVDVLVNNAGIMPIGPMIEEGHEIADRVVAINLLGYLTGMKLALPPMLAREQGQIVNVASVAGRSPVPGAATYAATKAAVVSLTESARVEYRGRGVSFTCVMPAFTATELVSGTKGTRFVKTVEPEDVAKAIAKAIARPRADVFVPGSVGMVLRTQPLIGRRLRDAANRAIRADRTLLEIDAEERAAYEARISGDPGTGASKS